MNRLLEERHQKLIGVRLQICKCTGAAETNGHTSKNYASRSLTVKKNMYVLATCNMCWFNKSITHLLLSIQSFASHALIHASGTLE